MKIKALIISISLIAVTLGIIYLRGSNKKIEPQNGSGFFINKNAIYVTEQAPGQHVVISVVRLKKAGYVVIHEDAVGAPGKVLGASSLLSNAEIKNLPIALSRATQDNETVYAMLHFDNGDEKFNAADDKPVLDPVGNEPVMMVVTMSGDAVLPGVVSP